MNRISPVFKGCDRCIVFCANNRYLPLTSVAIQSVLENRNTSDKYDILLFYSEIKEEHVTAFEQMFGNIENFSVRLINIKEIINGKTFYIKNRPGFAQEAYYRLFIPWILDEDYHNAVYLDGDIILCEDISLIYKIELGNNYIGAVRDWGIISFCNSNDKNEIRNCLKLGLHEITDYVNSGLVLFNLNAWRQKYSFDYVLDECASKKWRWHDQDVLNVLCLGKTKIISPEWNYLYDSNRVRNLPAFIENELEAVKEPFIIHYFGDQKSCFTCDETFDLKFWRYAAHTKYYNELVQRCKDIKLTFRITRLIQEMITRDVNGDYPILVENIEKFDVPQSYGQIFAIKLIDNTLHLEGRIVINQYPNKNGFEIYALVGNHSFEIKNVYIDNELDYHTLLESYCGERFYFDYKLDTEKENQRVSFYIIYDSVPIMIKKLFQGPFSPLSLRFKHSYYYKNEWMVVQDGDTIVVKHIAKQQLHKKEKQFVKELNEAGGIAGKKSLLIRPMAFLLRRIIKKQIWLISGCVSKTCIKSEMLFKHINTNYKNDIRCYYVIDNKSADYNRLKQYGPVISLRDYRHKFLLLCANWNITSQVHEDILMPFGDFSDCYADLLSNSHRALLEDEAYSYDIGLKNEKEVQLKQFDMIFDNYYSCELITEKLLNFKDI